MGKKLKITEEQHISILNEILKENFDKMKESDTTIDEGLWDNIKYALSKLGRYKAAGKIRGKSAVDQEYSAKIAQIIDKKGNEAISNLDAEIKKTNPEFPNNKDPQLFLSTILSIAAVYDSIIAATKLNPNEAGYMPIDVANGVITDLREYVKKYLDVDLKAVYSSFNESEQYELNEAQMCEIDEAFELTEAEPLDAKDVRSGLQAKRGENTQDFESDRMKTLKSWRLPLALMGAGASFGALSWLIEYIFPADKITTYTPEQFQAISEKTIGNVKPLDGMTQTFNSIPSLDANLTPNSSPDEIVDVLSKIGGGDPQAGVNIITQEGGIFRDPDLARQTLTELVNDPHGRGDTLKDVFTGTWAGTNKTIGDTLVTQPGGTIKTMMVKMFTRWIAKTVAKKSAMAIFAAPILKTLGIGLLGAGALVKLLRVKGQKSSRAATLNTLYQSIRNIEGGVLDVANNGEETAVSGDNTQTQQQQKTKVAGNAQDDLYNSLRNLFQFIVNNKNTLGSNITRESYEMEEGNVGDRRYKSGQIMKGGQRAKKGGETQTAHDRFFGNKPFDAKAYFDKKREERKNKKELDENELMSEGKYITDKRVIQYMSKSLPFDKVKNFENLITRVEYIRNVLKKMSTGGNFGGDTVIQKFLGELNANPIMNTDFVNVFKVNPDNPQEVNSLMGMIKEILTTIYSGQFKFDNIVGKMSTLGGGNVNKLEEEPAYNAAQPNKSFAKDAQSKTAFKNNLLKFLKTTMSLFQYLHKLKTQGAKNPKQQQFAYPKSPANAQQAAPQNAAPITESVDLELKNELNKIKTLMNKIIS